MQLAPPLQAGVLVRRYKRFLADIVDANNENLTIHCPNTGAMTGCSDPDSRVWYSDSQNPKRKYRYTLEYVDTPHGRVGVNTHRANQIVGAAIAADQIEQLSGYQQSRAEAAIPVGNPQAGREAVAERGRFDFLLTHEAKRPCYVEVKSMTLLAQHSAVSTESEAVPGLGIFPDAVSERALKHVLALQTQVEQGNRGVLFFCVQHTGITTAGLAQHIDPTYAAAVKTAIAAGVEVLAYNVKLEPHLIELDAQLPLLLV